MEIDPLKHLIENFTKLKVLAVRMPTLQLLTMAREKGIKVLDVNRTANSIRDIQRSTEIVEVNCTTKDNIVATCSVINVTVLDINYYSVSQSFSMYEHALNCIMSLVNLKTHIWV